MKALIIGGGIAGLTAAIAMRQRNIEVLVLEQAARPTEIGAGIQIAANGSKVLRALGIEQAVANCAVIPEAMENRDMLTGNLVWRIPLGREAAALWGAPLYNIHRADLIELLAKAVPDGCVEFGVRCTGFEQDEKKVSVRAENGRTYEADILIGADGIHSMVRKQLFGEDSVHFSNILMWRSLLTADELEGIKLEEKGNYWYGPGRTLITYWIRPKKLYSILASVPAAEIQRESWDETGDLAEFRKSFSGLEPRAQAMVDRIHTAFITGMYYRDPIMKWSVGRVTLAGDAAHPMVPYLAQGACQGIEDAWVLTTMLERHTGRPVDALAEYEARRRPYTTRVQSGARAIVKMCHESEHERILARNGNWKGMQRIDPMSRAVWEFVWGHDVLQEVDRPAGEVQGLSVTREGKRMKRPESQRAFQLWKDTFAPEDVARGYAGMRAAYERFLEREFPLPEGVSPKSVELGSVPGYRLVAPGKEGTLGTSPCVLHFHGGGYIMGSARGSLEYASRLAATAGGQCVTIDYRLAPEHPYPAAVDDALDAYRGLLASGVDPARIVLSGESAGGGLAIALAQLLRQAGEPLPAGILAICPFADLTLSSPSIQAAIGEDPAAPRDVLALMASYYFQGHEPKDPLVSPLFGQFEGLPPMFVSAVVGESLHDDARRIAEKARNAGVKVTTEWVEDSVHVYTLFPFLPETSETMRKVGAWIAGIGETR